MNVSRRSPRRYEGGAVRQNIYAVGAITATALVLTAMIRVMAWVAKGLLPVLVVFVAVSYVTERTRRGRRFVGSPVRPDP